MTDSPHNLSPTVAVRGEATIEVEPEVARVNITISARERERERTVRILGDQGRALVEIISRFGSGVEKTETTDLSVYPEMRQGGSDRVERYVGQSSTVVTVTDFSVLSDLVVAVGELPAVSVSGPYWELRRTSPRYRDARIAATADAVRRAREYADAFGCQLTGLVEVADQGMSASSPITGQIHSARAAMGRAEGVDRALDLQPAKQQVYGSMEARFTMTPADLATVFGTDSAGSSTRSDTGSDAAQPGDGVT